MSNPLESIGKVFKEVIKSDFGKVLMVAAAIYTGGAAYGAWGGTGASTGLAATGSELGALGATGAAPAATSGLAATTGAGAVEGAAATTAAGVEGTAATAAATPTLATGAAGEATMGASLKGAASSMLNFVEAHPAATLMAGNMLQSAFTPTAAEQEEEIARNRRERSTYYGTGYGGQGGGLPLGNLGVLSKNVPVSRPAPGILGKYTV